MTSNPCTCDGTPESCEATVKEHRRQAAEGIVGLSHAYDRGMTLTPAQQAKVDQAAAAYRSVLMNQGIDPRSSEDVGILAVSTMTQLMAMTMIRPLGPCMAMSAAKTLVASLPLLVEMADG
jgi:hypothetical protein